MLTFKDSGSRGASEREVIRTQIEILMEVILGHVQDLVCTSSEVLHRPPLALGTQIKEAPVWGIDSYTRRMVELAIEDRLPPKRRPPHAVKFFIEKLLLPTINSQPIAVAHNITASLKDIIEVIEEA